MYDFLNKSNLRQKQQIFSKEWCKSRLQDVYKLYEKDTKLYEIPRH